MIDPVFRALFVAEGSSDAPLAEIVTALFLDRGVELQVSNPDYSALPQAAKKDLKSRFVAGRRLMGDPVDVLITHRDTDNTDHAMRRTEMEDALRSSELQSLLVPVIPIRMTETWLLLDESAIRHVAGNPRGRAALNLPSVRNAERLADPKSLLRHAFLAAADATGRRRERLDRRFDSNRRQLLESLDTAGPVCQLESWRRLVQEVDRAAAVLVDRATRAGVRHQR